MVNINAIKKLFSKKLNSFNTVRDIHNEKEKHFPDEFMQFFPTHLKHHTLRRRFCENFYKCLDVHKRPRLVKKSGELNIHTENVHKRRRRLWSDIFNTILDIKWRWHFFIFLFSFVLSWFLFANIWYLISWLHGDLYDIYADEMHQPLEFSVNATRFVNGSQNIGADLKLSAKLVGNEKRTPCVFGIHDFTSALLYSVETQHTIGYGLRYITEECSFAIIFLMVQSCFGIFVQGLVAGVVFAKISRPNKRKRTIIFSHNACVSERDGKLCLMFKLANIRISQLSDARVKMHMIKSRRTTEGEFIPFQSYDMKVGHNWSGNDSIFFPWPKTVEHVIDEDSPLYEMCKQASVSGSQASGSQTGRTYKRTAPKFDSNTVTNNTNTMTTHSTLLSGNASAASDSNKSIKSEDYEIVVILEGNIETTGASCHIRTSYLPQEILFGYRFTPIYPKFTDFEYLFDYAKFDHVEPIQYDLLGLNVAFTNKHLNYVYDARDESKNLYQTVQNTGQINPLNFNYSKKNDGSRGAENSIFSLLKAFGSNNINSNHNNTEFVNNNENNDEKQLQHQNDLTNFLEDNKNEFIKSGNEMNSVINEQDLNQTSTEVSKPSKTGRFTIEAVRIESQSMPLSIENHPTSASIYQRLKTSNINENSQHQKNSLFLKKTASSLQKRNLSKQVLFQMKNNANSLGSMKHAFSNHYRASSLPPPKLLTGQLNYDRKSFDNSMCYRKKSNSFGVDDEKKDNNILNNGII